MFTSYPAMKVLLAAGEHEMRPLSSSVWAVEWSGQLTHQLPWDYRPQSTVSWRMINDSLSWWDDGIYSNHLGHGWHRALPGVRIAWVVCWVLRTARLSSPLGPTHANHHKFKQSLAMPGSRLLISCNKITIEMFTSTKLPQDRWRASSHFRI